MIKWLIRLILFIVFVFIAINLAGNIVVGKMLSEELGVTVKVGKISLDPFRQEAGIFALRIGNPNDFNENLLASIPEISLKFDLKALLKQQLIIKELRLHISEVIIEKNSDGKFNLIELKPVKSSFDQKKGSDTHQESQKTETEGKKMGLDVIMEDVYVAVGRAKYVENVKGKAVVKEVNLGMKEFALDDVSNLNELVKQIAYKMMQTIGLKQISAIFENEASEKIGSFMNKVKDSMNF